MDINVLTRLSSIKEFFDIKPDEDIKPGTKTFLEAMTEKKYMDGQVVVAYGEEADDGMYIITQGQADVYNSEDELINQLVEGDIIGELALINDEKRAATVKASGELVCANITRDLFEEIIISNRKIIGSFMSMLYRRTTRLLAEKESIKFMSEHDQLTGLYNKGKYLSMLKDTIPNLGSIGLFNMDVNNLKKINDSLGHEAGDRLLIKAADSIKAVTNDKIYGFRMGGDEYLLIAMNVTSKQVDELKEAWEESLSKLNQQDDEIECVVAVGVVYAEAPFDFAEISQRADNLMYEDKKRKKKPGEDIR